MSLKQTKLSLMKRIIAISAIMTFPYHCLADKDYDGVVEPFMTTSLNIGGNGAYRGVIDMVARQNTVIYPSIFDSKGKVIDQGDILVKMRPAYFKADIISSQGQVDLMEGQLLASKDNYERSEDLVKKNVISKEQFQADRDTYFDDVYKLRQAKDTLAQAKVTLKNHTVWTPYPAYVKKVFVPGGVCSTIPAAVEIEELNPVWVSVEMSRDTARNINFSTPVTVKSLDGKVECGVIHEFGRLTDNGYQFAVYNYPELGETISYEGKSLPVIRRWHHVLLSSEQDGEKILAAPVELIYKDDKGFYVWSTDMINSMPGKGIKQVATIKKTYVKPTSVYQQINGCIRYAILSDSGDLKQFQILVESADNLKEGEQVYLNSSMFKLMPGDKVKVTIGGLSNEEGK